MRNINISQPSDYKKAFKLGALEGCSSRGYKYKYKYKYKGAIKMRKHIYEDKYFYQIVVDKDYKGV